AFGLAAPATVVTKEMISLERDLHAAGVGGNGTVGRGIGLEQIDDSLANQVLLFSGQVGNQAFADFVGQSSIAARVRAEEAEKVVLGEHAIGHKGKRSEMEREVPMQLRIDGASAQPDIGALAKTGAELRGKRRLVPGGRSRAAAFEEPREGEKA